MCIHNLSPRFSIITVTYNARKTLESTIQSVIAQTYPYMEYIVIDGASTDGTLSVIEKYRLHIHTLIS
ncbi:putative teichuronic acid biosynthesis glycosyltransferase TuaG, partial [termite gut metagenome]